MAGTTGSSGSNIPLTPARLTALAEALDAGALQRTGRVWRGEGHKWPQIAVTTVADLVHDGFLQYVRTTVVTARLTDLGRRRIHERETNGDDR